VHASTELDSLDETCIKAALAAIAALQYTSRLLRRQPTRRRIRLAGARGAQRRRARHEQGRAPVSCAPPPSVALADVYLWNFIKRVLCPASAGFVALSSALRRLRAEVER
jgi:hypothetical protein